MSPFNRSFFLTVSLVAMGSTGCGLIGVKPDETNDPSIDPIVRAAARVRAESGESNPNAIIDAIHPDAAGDPRAELEEERQKMIHTALRSGDIVLGMRMEDVSRVWGEPRSVDTAGDPSLGNQRWVYFDGLSSRWSMSSKRIVYFERGRVIGWEQER